MKNPRLNSPRLCSQLDTNMSDFKSVVFPTIIHYSFNWEGDIISKKTIDWQLVKQLRRSSHCFMCPARRTPKPAALWTRRQSILSSFLFSLQSSRPGTFLPAEVWFKTFWEESWILVYSPWLLHLQKMGWGVVFTEQIKNWSLLL